MNILDLITNTKKYQDVLDTLFSYDSKDVPANIYIGNIAPNIAKMLSCIYQKKIKQSIIYVCSNIFEASKAYEVFCDLIGINQVSFFPVEEFISTDIVASSSSFRLARMLTLNNILNNTPQIIVTNVEGITKNIMSKQNLEKAVLKFSNGDIIEIESLIYQLIIRGYKRASVTSESGTFSVRGSIVDIFPINHNVPVRLNFFDNEIEEIKSINIDTQLSNQKINEINIFPLYDIFYDSYQIPQIKEKILKSKYNNYKIEQTINALENYQNTDSLYMFLPYIDENYISFLQLFDKPICIFEDFNELREMSDKTYNEVREYISQQTYRVEASFFKKIDDILKFSKVNIFIHNFISSLNNIKLDKYFDLKTSNTFEYNNNLKVMIDDISTNVDKTYFITHTDEQKLSHIEEVLEARNLHYYIISDFEKIRKGKINVGVVKNAYGFNDYENLFEVLTPNEFAPSKINKNTKYQKFYHQSTKIYSKDELVPGDYVVHQNHGIAIYLGIKTIELRNKKNDYLALQYAGESKLYIPMENIYLLEKYIGSRDQIPKLSNLNSKEWAKKKAKVKEKVVDVAKQLLKVQAEREAQKGFIYQKDSEYQKMFEQDFLFEETPDQLKAIEEVKSDMEGSKPLDRLICGDVGFGKTEVAMRAAFKAVENGKQVAYLAPTTVLTRQHYYTFKERFEKYGIRVELVNRFVSLKKQKSVIEDLKKGYVDIVIGTHRLLSSEFQYKDLGLLIIDEEQRFGVTHKEKIKELKSIVDVLTLTATPIPRTLQMALSGLKDLSLIETPPTNRLPIQTYVLESNDSVVREAINREMARGGQIFYLLNRIDRLENLFNRVKRLVPKARIGLIHGRLTKEVIEEELNNFLDHHYDVLLCTTIIETGIDIPNANTLLIERADILGLSQLYQIRGRVGRSDKIAYAYLMYDADSVLTEDATKRLETIKEFTALGSGYKIAMRDLAIRGAGDILGYEQSGYIDAIGMDLYMKLLSEVLNEMKGVKNEIESARPYNIDISRHISPRYVEDEGIRIEIHQSINKIRSRDQINSLIDEYTDRYGKLSNEVLIYMEEKYLEYLLKKNGIENYREKDNWVYLNFDEEKSYILNAQKLKLIAKQFAPKFVFELSKGKIYIKINTNDYLDSYIFTLTKFLENI